MNAMTPSPSLETDWDRLDRMTDEDINYSDVLPLGDEFFARARLYVPPSKRVQRRAADEADNGADKEEQPNGTHPT